MKAYWRLAVVLLLGVLSACQPGPGTIQAIILGLPDGVGASVTVSGSGFSKTLTASETLFGLKPGTYTVSAQNVSSGGLTYSATLSAASLEVKSGQTAELDVAYVPPTGSSTSATISVATGGTLRLGPATLSIPPNAFVGSSSVTVTLKDLGKPQSSDPGDPLKYTSDAFVVSASGARINPDNPLSLSIVPYGDGVGGAQDLIVAERAPEVSNVTTLYRPDSADQGPKFAPITYKYDKLDYSHWVVTVPTLTQTPKEQEVLQVPWYYQSSIPWCAPTSLTAMLRYYDFDETAGNPNDLFTGQWMDLHNAIFGPSTALAPWQTARAQRQAKNSGGGWGAMDNMGLSGKYTIYLWDAAAFLPNSGAKGGFNDFEVYTILVNTGLFGLVDRRPMVMIVDNWWHSVTVVGVDSSGLFYHDSNGSVAYHTTWSDFQADATGWKKDAQGKNISVQTIWTGVLNIGSGVAVKDVNKRRGSLVLGIDDVSFQDTQGLLARLDWDGADPHIYGYYFNNANAGSNPLGAIAQPGQNLSYRFRVANVTNVPLSYTAEVALTDESNAVIGAPVSTSLSVNPYSIGSYTFGNLTVPNANGGAILRFRLFQGGVLQDVKYFRFNTPFTPPR